MHMEGQCLRAQIEGDYQPLFTPRPWIFGSQDNKEMSVDQAPLAYRTWL